MKPIKCKIGQLDRQLVIDGEFYIESVTQEHYRTTITFLMRASTKQLCYFRHLDLIFVDDDGVIEEVIPIRHISNMTIHNNQLTIETEDYDYDKLDRRLFDNKLQTQQHQWNHCDIGCMLSTDDIQTRFGISHI